MKQHFLAAALAGIAIATLSSTLSADALGNWRPAPPVLGKLAGYQPCGAYEVRPPKGYTLMTQQGPNGATANSWVSPGRTDGTKNYIMVVLLTPPKSELSQHTLTDILGSFVAGVGRRRANFQSTAGETGTIHGLTFARSYWSGIESTTGQKMHGFIYVAIDGDQVVEIASQDVDQYRKASLALTEASALTIRKR